MNAAYMSIVTEVNSHQEQKLPSSLPSSVKTRKFSDQWMGLAFCRICDIPAL